MDQFKNILKHAFYFILIGWRSITVTANYLIQGWFGFMFGILVAFSPASIYFKVLMGVIFYAVGMIAEHNYSVHRNDRQPDPIFYIIIAGACVGYLWGYVLFFLVQLYSFGRG